MAKPDLGTKRTCPTTGKKFYDLNKDPIVSPYTGESFSRSSFDPPPRGPARAPAPVAAAAVADDDELPADPLEVATVSLDDVAADEAEKDHVVPDDDADAVPDDDADAADDTFLPDEEEEGDDVADLIDGDIEDDEEA